MEIFLAEEAMRQVYENSLEYLRAVPARYQGFNPTRASN